MLSRTKASSPSTGSADSASGTNNRNIRLRATVFVAAAALGAGLAVGTSAEAASPAPKTATSATSVAIGSSATATDAASSVSAQAKWVTLYHNSKKSKSWNTGAVKSRSKVFQIVIRSWNGGDGTKFRVRWQQRSGKKWKTLFTTKWRPSDGNVNRFRSDKAKKGATYRAQIQLAGQEHTSEIWLQNYA